MKRLLLVLAVVMVVSCSGCGTIRNWWNRGARCRNCVDVGYGEATIVHEGVETMPAKGR